MSLPPPPAPCAAAACTRTPPEAATSRPHPPTPNPTRSRQRLSPVRQSTTHLEPNLPRPEILSECAFRFCQHTCRTPQLYRTSPAAISIRPQPPVHTCSYRTPAPRE